MLSIVCFLTYFEDGICVDSKPQINSVGLCAVDPSCPHTSHTCLVIQGLSDKDGKVSLLTGVLCDLAHTGGARTRKYQHHIVHRGLILENINRTYTGVRKRKY